MQYRWEAEVQTELGWIKVQVIAPDQQTAKILVSKLYSGMKVHGSYVRCLGPV